MMPCDAVISAAVDVYREPICKERDISMDGQDHRLSGIAS